MDVDFLLNNTSAPKLTWHNLGIGLPEAKWLYKYTETNTVWDLVSWYFKKTRAEVSLINFREQGKSMM